MDIGILMSLNSPWAREIAEKLSSLGHDVHVFDFTRKKSTASKLRENSVFQDKDIELFNSKIKTIDTVESELTSELCFVDAGKKLKKLFKEYKMDVLLTLYGGGYASMAYFSGFHPYVVYVVGSDILTSNFLRRTTNKIFLNSASLVFVNGKYLTTQTEKIVKKCPVKPLYIGLDTSKFISIEKNNEEVTVVNTRSFLPVYNNGYLIEAISHIPEEEMNFKVIFTSSGTELEKVKALTDKILSKETAKKIKFLGGVSGQGILDNLNKSDIYVSLSRSDGASISLFEALASGLYPILSDIPQNREWVTPQESNGILVPLDNPKMLAEKLLEAVRNKEKRDSVKEYNRRIILERADIDKNMRILISNLEKLKGVAEKLKD